MKDKTPEIILDKWQRDFLITKGDKILCCGRQVGKSLICGIDAAEYTVNNENETILIIAPTERQAFALFEKVLSYLAEHYKYNIKMGKDRPTKSKINLTNKTKIYCLPTGQSGLGIRFLTVNRLYVDEAAQVPEEVWVAVNPMLLSTGGDSVYLSTPFGKQGEFYRTWINDDEVYDSFKRFSATSETVMRERPLSEVWTQRRRERALIKLEQGKARMSKKEYAQEYLGQFMDELFQLFSDEIIKRSCILKRRNAVFQGRTYFLGVDIARLGDDEGTYEVLEKLNNNTLIQVESIITRKKLTTETFDRIVQLESQWKFKKIGIDAGSGSLGVGIMDFLLREPGVKRKIVALNNLQRQLDHLGENKVKLLKEDMYMNLLALMERGIIQLLDDDEVTLSLRSIQFENVIKQGQPTKVRIFGNYAHITEGLIRATWLANQKHLNTFIDYV